ncbi:phosphoribomutase PRM15 [Aspergillus fischeri NRRL 181]|uniref:Phosphoglucomutase n=1 Tax=Neosartorya fischeri (strain ATCC 1020 / DSM 3700 / CBS 544.65 / FGSC A1164 / JCM 1740 / NRRL 181 / WB 181) TaxID=331117 RepID=A1CYR1_NEOFI|nr:phosphoglucomutase [Aspergillus fischeri NRRL 181]EAW23881.1 phosphoglucomutase [Aspergillus fischeri NRRL 181]
MSVPTSTIEEPLSLLVQKWLEWDRNPETRAEIEQLQEAGATAELELRLRQRIQFGTAGLRGRMAAGFSCMNSLTVIQASQGLAKYIRDNHSDIAPNGVVIGHDARHNSAKFAALAANAFIAMRIPVWYYSESTLTPSVPFGVTHLRAAAGVMITASHNPAQDNGYKVYFKNGAQINTPMDVEIAQSIDSNLEPWPNAWNSLEAAEYLHAEALQTILPRYTEAVWNYAKSTVPSWSSPCPFMYTPLHGVGGLILPELCRSVGITDFAAVTEQVEPNPDFPTVSFPNPEENGSLDLAMQSADKEGKTLIIANDPDADRFAAAEKVDSGSWFTFTGNHLGVLLASHLFDSLEGRNDKSRIAVLNSAVSTDMLEKMARSKGFHFEETLTGFKWMGNIARRLEEAGYHVPFAFEEALGYMFPDVCHDKDGVTAAMVFLAAEARWRSQGLTPYSKLQQLFKDFGYFETLNNYFRSPSPEITKSLFGAIRNGPYRTQKSLGSFKILRWRDMTEGYDSGTEDQKPALPIDKSSQMLTIWLDRDVRFTIRGSGTEPKVKVYIESCGASHAQAVDAVCDTFRTVLKEWIRPFAPSMSYSKILPTSSGHILNID